MKTTTPGGLRARATFVAAVIGPIFAATAYGQQAHVEPLGQPVPAAPVTEATTPAPVKMADHVIVVSIDGLRPDAIDKYGAKTMQRLIREGSHSLQATTILPSKTLPSHTSMLTGTEPHVHGVHWNSEKMDDHGHVATPTIFAAAKQAGLHTAAFFSKSKFLHLAVPGTLDHAQAPTNWLGKWTADKTVDDAEAYIEEHRPNLLFVHLGEPDFVGHAIGWMTWPYGMAVRQADEELGELLETAEKVYGAGNYTVIVTADHGGHGRDHGSDDPRDTTIPWITWGKGVAAGVTLEPGIRTMDTAATALWLLGLEADAASVGRAVTLAFTPAAQTVKVAAAPAA